jgi:hypothetical protein
MMKSGSLAQRYVKRHPGVRKRAETGRFCRFSSPNFAVRFRAEILGLAAPAVFWRALTGADHCVP